MSKESQAVILMCASAGAAFFAGAIATWVLIDAQPGSRADWMAAWGTWVVGAAASGLAWQAKKMNSASEKAANRSQLRVMRVQVIILASLAERLLQLPEDDVSATTLRSVAGGIMLKCDKLNMNLPVVADDDELEVAVADVDYRALAMQAMARELVKGPGVTEPIGVSTCHEYRWLRENAQKFSDDADKLGKILTSKIEARD